MGKTRLQAELACWKPVPTTIPAEWAMWIEELARETVGSPRPAHAYVLNVIRYDAREVGKLLQNWGLPWQVVAAGYLRIYDEELIKRRQLLDRERVMSHFKESLLYSRYIEEEQLGPLLSLPHRDLGALLIAVAIHYQSLVQLSKSEQRPGDDQKRRPRIESTGRILLHICKRLGMWRFKRQIENLIEQLADPLKYKQDEQRYCAILERDDEKIEDVRCMFVNYYQRTIGQQIEIEVIPCEVSGLKRRELNSYAPTITQKRRLSGFDLVVFNVIVPTVKDCYTAFGVLNQLGILQDRVADQIANPKPNGYSLLAYELVLDGSHSVLQDLTWLSEERVCCFLQIATAPLHAIMYYGCLYPECYLVYTQTLPFRKHLYELPSAYTWNSPVGRALFAIKKAIVESEKAVPTYDRLRPIIVYDKHRNPVALEKGATILDFAYQLAPHLGNQIAEAYVNNRRVPLYRELDAGDVVEIRTGGELQIQDDWFDGRYAITKNALDQMRKALKNQLHRYKGYVLIDRALRRQHYTLSFDELDDELSLLVAQYRLGTRQIYLENFKVESEAPYTPDWAAQQIIKRREQAETQSEGEAWLPQAIDSEQLYPLRLCYVCQPAYPQRIVGNRRRGSEELIVHTITCGRLHRRDAARHAGTVPMDWRRVDSTLKVTFTIEARDRRGLVHDLAKRLRRHQCLLLGINGRVVMRWRKAELSLQIEVINDREALALWDELSQVESVTKVEVDAEGTDRLVYASLVHQKKRSYPEQAYSRGPVASDQRGQSLTRRNRILKNPYDISRPATAQMFVGRSYEMDRLNRELCESERGKAVLLYGPRRSGKTSLCKNFLERYVTPPFWYTFYSLQNVVGENEEVILRWIAEAIAHAFQLQLGVEAPHWNEQAIPDIHACFTDFLCRCLALTQNSRLILVLDEFGSALDAYQARKLDVRFFSFWRHLMEEVPQLSLLISLPTRAHMLLTSNEFSNAFSFAQSLPVSYLDSESASHLLVDPLEEQHIQFASQTVAEAMRLTGGNPYYLALLGLQLVFFLNMETNKEYVTKQDIDRVVNDIIGAGSIQNFIFYGKELQDEQELDIIEAIVELTEQNGQATVSLQQLLNSLNLSVQHIRSRLERLRNGLVLGEYIHRKPSNPYYAFKVELVRYWLQHNRWFFHYFRKEREDSLRWERKELHGSV
uniref:TGS domain-containing protein n=1 Tax=Thermosporothrix sp. COM3 TaxID=2490863 RepID=A0A455SN94_9CHLR|nr:hypothetical protein KTC_38810 [Thermosporothrix sp. COM3]